jgi:hypothetical protein
MECPFRAVDPVSRDIQTIDDPRRINLPVDVSHHRTDHEEQGEEELELELEQLEQEQEEAVFTWQSSGTSAALDQFATAAQSTP